MSSGTAVREGIYKIDAVRRFMRWVEATPHPLVAFEISPEQVAGVRFGRAGSHVAYDIEPLPKGAIVPSAIESNMANITAVKAAVAKVCEALGAKDEDVALLVPDPVIRVFVQHFDEFPRSADEAIPMLRWKLKKSVPFEVEETLLSYMRQAPKAEGVDVVTAIARLRIVKEYESVLEEAGLRPGVVLSTTLAAVSLLEDQKPTLLARVAGTSLTTAIVREGVLAGYRCTELPVHTDALTPHLLLEEIYPLAAYYQDTWQEGIQAVRVAGLGNRLPEFVRPLEEEFKCSVRSLLSAAISDGNLRAEARPLADHELEGLVGWMLQQS
ncbi:MAG TPA: pilus assembly protein PilM [Candidatus Acidoferrum sp.]|nr:pilus assembly protein PilM [Candidatus Acidoferrum sp.]